MWSVEIRCDLWGPRRQLFAEDDYLTGPVVSSYCNLVREDSVDEVVKFLPAEWTTKRVL